MNWTKIYNRLFQIINTGGDTYFSGPRFIKAVRQVEEDFPDYNNYIEQRRQEDKSTTRETFFFDILMSLDISKRVRVINNILDSVEHLDTEKVSELRQMLHGDTTAPMAEVVVELWNADRLNKYLSEIDACIAAGNFERAVTLSYTCLEGFYKSFARQKIADGDKVKSEIITLSKAIQTYLKQTVKEYPDEAITMINHISHTVDKARNGFSEAHFGEETGSWLAVYIRDLVNSQIRLLLHFI